MLGRCSPRECSGAGLLASPLPRLQALAAQCLGARGDCVRPPWPLGTLPQLVRPVRCSQTSALARTEIPEAEAPQPLSIIKVISGPPLMNPNFQNKKVTY